MLFIRATVLAISVLVFVRSLYAQSDPVIIETTNGERFRGSFLTRGESEAFFKSELAGELKIAVQDIDSIQTLDGDFQDYQPDVAAESTDEKPGEKDIEKPASKWKRELELGASGSNGNSNSATGNAAVRFSIDSDAFRANAGAWYFLGRNDGDRSRNEARVYGTFDKYLNSIDPRLFAFVRTQYDYDEFQSWQNRVSVYAGPGYDFYKQEKFTLTGRTGLGFTQEFGGVQDDFRFEAFVGLDTQYRFNPSHSIALAVLYYPSLEDFNDGRVESTLKYTADIDRAKGLALRIGLINEYEFRTIGDADHNDWKYFINMLLKF